MSETNISSSGAGSPSNFAMNSFAGGVGGSTFLAQATMLLDLLEAQRLQIQLQTNLSADQGKIAGASNTATIKQGELQRDQGWQAMGFAIATGVLSIAVAAAGVYFSAKGPDLNEGAENEVNAQRVGTTPNESVSANIKNNNNNNNNNDIEMDELGLSHEAASGNISKSKSQMSESRAKDEQDLQTKTARDLRARAADQKRTDYLQKVQNSLSSANAIIGSIGSAGDKGTTAAYAEDTAKAQGAATINNSTSQQWATYLSTIAQAVQSIDALKSQIEQNYASAVQIGSQHS